MTIDIDVKCGICGADIEPDIDYRQRDIQITSTCPDCDKTIKEFEAQIGDLEDQIFELGREENA